MDVRFLYAVKLIKHQRDVITLEMVVNVCNNVVMVIGGLGRALYGVWVMLPWSNAVTQRQQM